MPEREEKPYRCVSVGMYDSLYECNKCHGRFIVQSDNPERDTPELSSECDCWEDISLEDKLKARIAELEEPLKRIVERWDNPYWREVEPTADVIKAAREALRKSEI